MRVTLIESRRGSSRSGEPGEVEAGRPDVDREGASARQGGIASRRMPAAPGFAFDRRKAAASPGQALCGAHAGGTAPHDHRSHAIASRLMPEPVFADELSQPDWQVQSRVGG